MEVCNPLPIIFPPQSIQAETCIPLFTGAEFCERHYVVFVDGKEWLVKQTTGNTSAHEAEIRGKLVSADDTSLYPDMLVDEPLFFPSADPPWSAIVTKRPVGRTARGALQEMSTRQELANFLSSAALALKCLHEAGISHRNFVPSELKILEDGSVVISSFILATTYDDKYVSDGADFTHDRRCAAKVYDGEVVGMFAHLNRNFRSKSHCKSQGPLRRMLNVCQ